MADTESEYPASLGRVVVVGGCGFLGSHIVSLLASRHPETKIEVLDLRTNANRHPHPTISYHDGDITDYDEMLDLFQQLRPDAVIHTASPHFNTPPAVQDKVNVGGTQNLVKASQEVGVKAFVYTSSASVVLDPTKELVNADETWPLVMGANQPEYYTTTKAQAELLVLSANRHPSRFLTAAIRPAGIMGEGDVQLLPKMVTAARKGQYKFQVGENNNLFDFTYVGNVAHGHLLALQALLQTSAMYPTIPLDHEKVDGEAFFITNDEPVYFWDFARAVWKEAGAPITLEGVWKLSSGTAMTIGAILENIMWLIGKTPNLTRQQVRYSTMNKYHSIEKAKRRLGYAPLWELGEGIRRGVGYILEQEKREAEKKGQ